MSGIAQVLLAVKRAAMTDPDFANVVLLLHFDGANASTTFTDSSGTPKTATASGDASLLTSNQKFGSACVNLDSVGDYVTVSSHADLAFPGDFCVEGHFRWTGSVGFNLFTLGTQNWNVYYDASLAQIKFWDGSADRITNTVTFGAAYRHVALTRSGTSVRLFLDGVQQGSTYTDSGPTSLGQTSLRIGAYPASGSVGGSLFQGQVDDFRVTKGVARYTGNFTPPASAFPNS